MVAWLHEMDLKAVLAQVNLLALIETDLGHGPAKQSSGKAFWSCPFHAEDRTPSLAVYHDHFHCFACGVHGNAFDWLMKRNNIEFKEALQMLSRQTSIAPGPYVAAPTTKIALKTPPSAAWQSQAIVTMMRACGDLWGVKSDPTPPADTAHVRDYLSKRGLRPDTLIANVIGGNRRPRYEEPTDWGFAASDKQVWIPEGIIIPILYTGTVWALKVRQRSGVEPKYIHVRGSVPGLFGAASLAGHDTAVICEGEFDALLLRQIVGDRVGVATFGGVDNNNDVLLNTWLPVLQPVKRLLIATDNDAAGDKAWEWWTTRTRRARRAAIPGGVKDITDAWRAGHDLRAWIEALL